MAFVPERPSPGGSHSAYLETKDAIYHMISCVEGLLPRVTSRRERRELLELVGRLERMIIEVMLVEELEDDFWTPAPAPADIPPQEDVPEGSGVDRADDADPDQSEDSPPDS